MSENKAVLIMDMPKKCSECILSCMINGKTSCCAGNKEIKKRYVNKKPDWCPLKPFPPKKRLHYDDLYTDTCSIGYNECLEEILAYTE